MKIYTKTGDKGHTGLLGGERTEKHSLRIKTIGEIDELNASLGVVRTYTTEVLDSLLERIQNWLFDVGAELACPPGGKIQKVSIGQEEIEALEKSIDEQTESLPPLKNFILPGGSSSAAHLHLARAVCRRAERSLCELANEEEVRQDVTIFINRLSDWLFVAARTANKVENVEDVAWTK